MFIQLFFNSSRLHGTIQASRPHFPRFTDTLDEPRPPLDPLFLFVPPAPLATLEHHLVAQTSHHSLRPSLVFIILIPLPRRAPRATAEPSTRRRDDKLNISETLLERPSVGCMSKARTLAPTTTRPCRRTRSIFHPHPPRFCSVRVYFFPQNNSVLTQSIRPFEVTAY
jgi:hypothetical protein